MSRLRITVTATAAAAIVAAGVVVYVASRPGEAKAFDSVAELAGALEERGVECRDAVFTENDAPGIDAVGYCTGSIGDYSLFVFDDPGRAQDEVSWNFMPLRDVDPETEDIFVVGANWIVIARSADAAERVRDAIGGEIHT